MDRQFVYIILAVAVLLFAGMMIKDWRSPSKKENKEPVFSGKESRLSITLPLCLQAYERLVVFLERMRVEALVHRLAQPNLSAAEMRNVLIAAIQSEYEHNISQQIYVSTASWEAVENAKEQQVHLINAIAAKLSPEASGAELNRELLNLTLKEEEWPATTALKVLNSESKKLLNGSNRS